MKFAVVFAGLALAGCSSLPKYEAVPDFTLTASNGQPFQASRQLAGKVWIADFVFTTCGGPCPRMSSKMRELQDKMRSNPNVRFVSFTVDPAHDTPEVLAEYSKHFRADPNRWFFLTGPRPVLHQLDRTTFLLGNVDGSLEHSTRFVLVDRNMRIRGYYSYDDPDNMKELLQDIDKLS